MEEQVDRGGRRASVVLGPADGVDAHERVVGGSANVSVEHVDEVAAAMESIDEPFESAREDFLVYRAVNAFCRHIAHRCRSGRRGQPRRQDAPTLTSTTSRRRWRAACPPARLGDAT